MNNNKALIESIKLLSKTLSKHEIAKKLGMSRHQLYRFCRKHNVKISEERLPKEAIFSTKTGSRNRFKPKKKTLILTSWEIRVKPDEIFISCLKSLAKRLNAELGLIPIWPGDVRFMPKILEDNFTIITDGFDINSNLEFEYVPTHALVTTPTTHWKSFSNKSVIIPALLKDMQTLPSVRLPKLIATTGSVGRLNAFSTDYLFIEKQDDMRAFIKRWSSVTNRRGGNIFAAAKHFVEPTALVIDIYNDKFFHARYVSMPTNKVMYDLDLAIYPDGRIEKHKPTALVLGDIHEINKDEVEFGKSMEMVEYFQPEYVFLNDYMDLASINHHEIHDASKNHKVVSLEDEAESGKSTLRRICSISKNVKYLQSNHDNFSEKWLNDPSAWVINRNYITALELQLYRIKENKHPIIKLLGLEDFENLEFIPENARYFVNETLIEHGHQGISGAKAGFYQLVRLYGNYICGHFHSFRQWRHGMQVGKIIRSNIEYASTGASSWICANGLLHPDDSKQGLFVVDGKWLKNY